MKRKLIVFSAFLSVLLLFFNFPVKANEVVFPAFPEPVEGQSSTHYLISYDPEAGSYYLLQPLNPEGVSVVKQGNKPYFVFHTFAVSYVWRSSQGSDSWDIAGEWDSSTRLGIEDTREFLYSSFDLYYSDGELFFPKAPIRESFLTQIQRVRMGATLETLVSLIPLLLVLVISFLAFRKAWSWLLMVLRQS